MVDYLQLDEIRFSKQLFSESKWSEMIHLNSYVVFTKE